MHPGVIMDTNLGTHLDSSAYGDINEITRRNTGRDFIWEPPVSKTVTQGASTTLVAALDPDIQTRSPACLSNCRIQEPAGFAKDLQDAEKLWGLSEKILEQTFS